jgi:hypothetical protein
MARGDPASEAPGQATKQGNAIGQPRLQPELFRSTDFTLAGSPFIVSDQVGERLHIDQCRQHSEPSALGPSRVDFEVFPADPA